MLREEGARDEWESFISMNDLNGVGLYFQSRFSSQEPTRHAS